MKKSDKIIYYIATGLFCALMLMSAGMYFFKNPDITLAFQSLGFPVYLIYPLAIAKILGVIAIATRISPFLKYFAYAGFFFNVVLAASAHLNVEDGSHFLPLVGLLFLITSYIFERRAFAAKAA